MAFDELKKGITGDLVIEKTDGNEDTDEDRDTDEGIGKSIDESIGESIDESIDEGIGESIDEGIGKARDTDKKTGETENTNEFEATGETEDVNGNDIVAASDASETVNANTADVSDNRA